MANSSPPVQDYMLQLAVGRLTPEKFALLQYKLTTGSRAATKIMHAIKPGEWEYAVGDTREFNDIRCRLETAIDDWIAGDPKSTGFVWPQPAPVQESTPTPSTNTANDTDAKFAQLDAHIAAFTRPGPIVRKKPTIMFVTDRRQPTPAPAVDQVQQAGIKPPATGGDQDATAEHTPPPLTTNEIANCFAELRGWNVGQWKKALNANRAWLTHCRKTKGLSGKPYTESTWWPVDIGAALVKKFHVPPKDVSDRFKKQEPLKPWATAWEFHDPESF